MEILKEYLDKSEYPEENVGAIHELPLQPIYIFLQCFVTEQIEEEMNADGLVRKLKLAGDSPNALFMLDRELAARVFTMPADSL